MKIYKEFEQDIISYFCLEPFAGNVLITIIDNTFLLC